jgi:geranylgeranyl pyrophosphate synthase
VKKPAQLSALPSPLAALERALSAGGACALDPTVPAAVWRRALVGPAAEFLSRPGKQLRSTIVRAGWVLGGGAYDALPERLPLIVEILHAGSLIVDDVEDSSAERRGAPALHRIVGVPLAINTGTWMYFWALAELAELGLAAPAELAVHRAAIDMLVRCHQGQALDLSVRIVDLEVDAVAPSVAAVTRLKTGSLCRFAAELGAIAAAARPETTRSIGELGSAIGTSLQMLDDLGALCSPTRRAKGREDLRDGRPTWPWAWLAEHGPFIWSRFRTLARSVAEGAADVDVLADELAGIVEPRGRTAIRAALDGVIACVGGSQLAELVATELRRMEDSYG